MIFTLVSSVKVRQSGGTSDAGALLRVSENIICGVPIPFGMAPRVEHFTSGETGRQDLQYQCPP